MSKNTLTFRLEGPLQSWGDQQSKFVVRRTADAPTKSGVMGLLCAALGIQRREAVHKLAALNQLQMGVRIDRPGIRWWDYQIVGAGGGMPMADGRRRDDPMPTRREVLCDASFLVALHGDGEQLVELQAALRNPVWPPYLGRRAFPPSVPLVVPGCEAGLGDFPSVEEALLSVPWYPRRQADPPPKRLDCLLEWRPGHPGETAPADALVFYDVAISFEPPSHEARFVLGASYEVGPAGRVRRGDFVQNEARPPGRPRADYGNAQYRVLRQRRLDADHGLCVFCKSPATTVQHVTYRRAGGSERPEDLRSLCRLCHDAVTMIEYGANMGMDRINPEDPRYRDNILEKRREIIEFRSLEIRRRKLAPEEAD
jgi:CRISPR system Cascade subunit CasD